MKFTNNCATTPMASSQQKNLQQWFCAQDMCSERNAINCSDLLHIPELILPTNSASLSLASSFLKLPSTLTAHSAYWSHIVHHGSNHWCTLSHHTNLLFDMGTKQQHQQKSYSGFYWLPTTDDDPTLHDTAGCHSETGWVYGGRFASTSCSCIGIQGANSQGYAADAWHLVVDTSKGWRSVMLSKWQIILNHLCKEEAHACYWIELDFCARHREIHILYLKAHLTRFFCSSIVLSLLASWCVPLL